MNKNNDKFTFQWPQRPMAIMWTTGSFWIEFEGICKREETGSSLRRMMGI